MNEIMTSVKIGGVNVVLEIDKMKYGRGKPVNGEWVFGGVERGTDKCFFSSC